MLCRLETTHSNFQKVLYERSIFLIFQSLWMQKKKRGHFCQKKNDKSVSKKRCITKIYVFQWKITCRILISLRSFTAFYSFFFPIGKQKHKDSDFFHCSDVVQKVGDIFLSAFQGVKSDTSVKSKKQKERKNELPTHVVCVLK